MYIRNIELLLIEEEQTLASPFQVTFVDAEGAEKKTLGICGGGDMDGTNNIW